MSALRPTCLAYRDLSTGRRAKEAAAGIFEALRWAEGIEGAERVYLPEISLDEEATQWGKEGDGGLLWAVRDRLTRAASGVVIKELQ